MMAEKLYYCDTCDVHLTGPQPAMQHYNGKKHQKKEAMNRSLTNPAVFAASAGVSEPVYCHSNASVAAADMETRTGSLMGTSADWMQRPSSSSNSVTAAPGCNVVMVPSLNPNLPPVAVAMTESTLPQTEYDFNGIRGSCHLCGVEFSSQQQADQHLSGQNHAKAKKRWEMKRDQLKTTVSGLCPSMQSKPIAMCQPLVSEIPAKDPISDIFLKHQVSRAAAAASAAPEPSAVVDGAQWFHCDVCDKKMNTYEQLELHKRSTLHLLKAERSHSRLVPGDNTVWVTCQVCLKRLNSAAQLEIHMASHSGPRAAGTMQDLLSCPTGSTGLGLSPVAASGTQWHHCDVCNKYMNTAVQLEQHRQSPVHNKKVAQRQNFELGTVTDNTAWYTCPVCAKKVNSSSQLDIHIKSHGLPDRSLLRDASLGTSETSTTPVTGGMFADLRRRLASGENVGSSLASIEPTQNVDKYLRDPFMSTNLLQLREATSQRDNKGYSQCPQDVTLVKRAETSTSDTEQRTPDHISSMISCQDPRDSANAVVSAAADDDKDATLIKLPQASVIVREQVSSDDITGLERSGQTLCDSASAAASDRDAAGPAADERDATPQVSTIVSSDQVTDDVTSLASYQAASDATTSHRDAAAAAVTNKDDNNDDIGVTSPMPLSLRPAESDSCEHASQISDIFSSLAISDDVDTTVAADSAAENEERHVRDEDLITTGCCENVGCAFHCELCDVHLSGEEPRNMHVTGVKHIACRKEAEQGIPVEPNPLFPGFRYHCELCSVPFNTLRDKKQHEKGQQHIAKSIRCVPAPDRSLPDVVLPTSEEKDDCTPGGLVKSKPRSYQEELYLKALVSNSICFLPTGTGKTLVSVMLMSRLLSLNPHHSAVFVVDRVLLALQQSKYIRRELGDKLFTRWNEQLKAMEQRKLRVAMLCGPKGDLQGCSLWEQDVVVITAAHYINLLDAGSMRWTDCCLIVIDEVHHCLKDHPYSRLIQLCRPWQVDVGRRPRLLGLTASPAGRETVPATVSMLSELMENLGADSLATVQQNVAELDRYQSTTLLSIRLVDYCINERELGCELLRYLAACRRKLYNLCDDPSCQELDTLPFPADTCTSQNPAQVPEINSELIQCLMDIVERLEPVDSSSQLKLAFLKTHIKVIGLVVDGLETLGLDSAYSDLSTLLKSEDSLGGFSHARELGLPCETLESMVAGYMEEEDRQMSTEKVGDDVKKSAMFVQLVRELETWWDAPRDDNRSPMALVLVRQRTTASRYATLLRTTESLERRGISVVHVVGHGGGGGGQDGGGMSVPQQARTLRDIHGGQYHVVVATSVAEEGVDLPDCDVVIRLDAPDCVRALVQVRGRARRADSRFIAFCRDEQQKAQLDALLSQEQHMVDAVQLIARPADVNQSNDTG